MIIWLCVGISSITGNKVKEQTKYYNNDEQIGRYCVM